MCGTCGTTQVIPVGSVLDGRAEGVCIMKVSVAQEVARTADPVDHPGSAHQGRIGMGIDIELQGGVHCDAAEPPDRFGMVGDGERPHEHLAAVLVPVAVETFEPFYRE